MSLSVAGILFSFLIPLFAYRVGVWRPWDRASAGKLAALFAERNTMEHLGQFVQCGLSQNEIGLQPTGVPPHTMILTHIQSLASNIFQILPALRRCSEETIEGVMKELEDRAIGAGTVTRDVLNDSIMRCLEEAGIPQILERLENRSDSGRNHTSAPETGSGERDMSNIQVYQWGGRFHKFPEDVEFPNGGVLEAWQWWIAGNAAKNYRPFRELEPMDCNTRNKRKRLCDYRYLMRRLESRARAGNFWMEDKTIEAANEMFECLSTVLNNVLKRQRVAQLRWISVTSILRKALNDESNQEL